MTQRGPGRAPGPCNWFESTGRRASNPQPTRVSGCQPIASLEFSAHGLEKGSKASRFAPPGRKTKRRSRHGTDGRESGSDPAIETSCVSLLESPLGRYPIRTSQNDEGPVRMERARALSLSGIDSFGIGFAVSSRAPPGVASYEPSSLRRARQARNRSAISASPPTSVGS